MDVSKYVSLAATSLFLPVRFAIVPFPPLSLDVGVDILRRDLYF